MIKDMLCSFYFLYFIHLFNWDPYIDRVQLVYYEFFNTMKLEFLRVNRNNCKDWGI